jgi:hypothetical protein
MFQASLGDFGNQQITGLDQGDRLKRLKVNA